MSNHTKSPASEASPVAGHVRVAMYLFVLVALFSRAYFAMSGNYAVAGVVCLIIFSALERRLRIGFTPYVRETEQSLARMHDKALALAIEEEDTNLYNTYLAHPPNSAVFRWCASTDALSLQTSMWVDSLPHLRRIVASRLGYRAHRANLCMQLEVAGPFPHLSRYWDRCYAVVVDGARVGYVNKIPPP